MPDNASNNASNLELWSRGAITGRTRQPRLLFSSVHEDADIERQLLALALEKTGTPTSEAKAFCIASGGDTAFALALNRGVSVSAVDINPAQIALCELKVAAIEALNSAQFQGFSQSDARLLFPRFAARLSPASLKFWRAKESALKRGLAFCGSVEGVFQIGARLFEWWIGKETLQKLFAAQTTGQTYKIFKNDWPQARWRLLFRLILNPIFLRLFYASGFLHDLPTAFPWRVRRRLETSLLRVPPRENPYIATTLHGRYSGDEAGWPPYLRPENGDSLRENIAALSLHTADAVSFLESTAQQFDFFALSNILDAAPADYGERLLHAVARSAKPGALVALRAITLPPNRAIAKVNELFEVETELTRQLQQRDLSPLCPLVAVLRVR